MQNLFSQRNRITVSINLSSIFIIIKILFKKSNACGYNIALFFKLVLMPNGGKNNAMIKALNVFIFQQLGLEF